jgi:putative endonuclease
MFFLYILRGYKNHLYVGTTTNIKTRIKRHESGDGAEFTKRNKTFTLVYSEEFSTLLEARKRENK